MSGNPWVPRWLKDLFDGVDVSADGTMAGNSDALLPTQKAVKTYVAANAGGGGALPVHDLAGASVDYALAVGETAKLAFAAATSIPLHVTTVDGGEYEIALQGNEATAASADNPAVLNPNNTTYAGAFKLTGIKWLDATSGGYASTSQNSFNFGSGTTIRLSMRVSTSTICKSAISQCVAKVTGSTVGMVNAGCYWADTTTPWTSLGTIVLNAAQSGTVIIRRIL